MSMSSRAVPAALAGPAIETSSRRRGPIGGPPRRRRLRPSAVFRHLGLLAGALVSLFPFYWMFVLATQPSAVIYQYPPVMTPGDRLGANVGTIMEKTNIWAAMANTFVVATSVTVLVLLIASLAAFAFAKFQFPGKNLLFGIVLATFLLPSQLATIPQFLVMSKLGWVGDLKALILPSLASAFGIFWLRQYATSAIPSELLEAATLDGCGFLRQYRHVCLPTIRPALAFLGIFTFIGSWNDFMWPLIVLTDPTKLTLQVALSQLKTAHGTDYGMLMASSLIAVLPLLVIFFLGAKQFMSGITEGAVKG
ncbi:cellobiose transport system permease protein [Tessaracoccus bendigoensis DSM 12906]|uniref:Cellobiose transport system permease protein n=1 Tax=Tessaracoccus bendigoensis DSM 12906 TaxID=1123357 RepID=A0A1M6MG67_9ACTN|nr:carbohydrate ABC transporter permease [Tessaracoccus bendigoensis]SHJ82428.1 cellobiose transport system permease protein [Tessaracoccus bendigoensis DSM 12906]